jgi:hypothetical protein
MKRTTVAGALAIIAASLSLAGVARAGHGGPEKAKKMKFDLVNSYHGPIGCSPNTQTIEQFGGNHPACTPALPSDPGGCGFTSAGFGKLSIIVTGNDDAGTQDIKVTAAAEGLNAECEGQSLCVTMNFRATTDDCPGSCTTPDAVDFVLPPPEFCCIVTGGECQIPRTSLTDHFPGSPAPGFFLSGKNTAIELLGCGLQRPTPSSAGNAVSCGILLK